LQNDWNVSTECQEMTEKCQCVTKSGIHLKFMTQLPGEFQIGILNRLRREDVTSLGYFRPKVTSPMSFRSCEEEFELLLGIDVWEWIPGEYQHKSHKDLWHDKMYYEIYIHNWAEMNVTVKNFVGILNWTLTLNILKCSINWIVHRSHRLHAVAYYYYYYHITTWNIWP
jgi:hypothetical protein